jgi:DNA polymerase V
MARPTGIEPVTAGLEVWLTLSAYGAIAIGAAAHREEVLRTLPVGDLWVVGRHLAPRLKAMGITTAGALRDAPPDEIMDSCGVTLARTQRELQGAPMHGTGGGGA